MRILAVGCHPDDLEIGCGGTLAKYAGLGHEVFMCHIANGSMGHAVIQPGELVGIRSEEAREAGLVLGAKEVHGLEVEDLRVDSGDLGTVGKVIDLIRETRPDLIITHSPEDYMRDHRETSRIVFDASFSASIPHCRPKTPVHAPIVPVYHMDTIAGIDFQPEEYVDITGTIETKLRALDKHQSQIRWLMDHDNVDFLDFVRTMSRFRGFQCGTTYAEGFRVLRTFPRLRTERLLP
ncbi:MAG: PIG-L deacetylase family protein [Clostridia bacterium]